ncbi:MAG: hypothetical protein ACOYOK_00225 [Pseudobdellovibrionaceae bacterium]
MNLSGCQIFNLDSTFDDSIAVANESDCSNLLLDWIVNNSLLKSEIFESGLEISNQRFFRFSIAATDLDGNQYHGFGRSKDRLKAASIAAGEIIERYVAKKVLKSAKPFLVKHHVCVQDAEISVTESGHEVPLPSSGFHSSNGWAVHFSLKKAVENSTLEALERHTLLYSYLHSGWNGFKRDSPVPFGNHVLTPYVSRFNFGGFGAGIVTTQGREFPGCTFGYLCDDVATINGSQKWLNAFFESYGQWESLSLNNVQNQNENLLSQYQKYFLTTSQQSEVRDLIIAPSKNSAKIKSNILMFDLKQALGLPFPFYAAYTFGGDLIPLFFRQKLSIQETVLLQQTLKYWSLPTSLPEYHPVL